MNLFQDAKYNIFTTKKKKKKKKHNLVKKKNDLTYPESTKSLEIF